MPCCPSLSLRQCSTAIRQSNATMAVKMEYREARLLKISFRVAAASGSSAIKYGQFSTAILVNPATHGFPSIRFCRTDVSIGFDGTVTMVENRQPWKGSFPPWKLSRLCSDPHIAMIYHTFDNLCHVESHLSQLNRYVCLFAGNSKLFERTVHWE